MICYFLSKRDANVPKFSHQVPFWCYIAFFLVNGGKLERKHTYQLHTLTEVGLNIFADLQILVIVFFFSDKKFHPC